MKRLLSRLFRLLPRGLLRLGLFLANAKFNHGAVGIFCDDQGRLLVLRHVFRKTYPWGFPSGFVGAGEEAAAAAVRELHEETGLAATVIRVGTTTLVAPRHLETLVYGRIDSPAPVKLSAEIFEARWVTPGQVPPDIVDGSPPAHRPLLTGTERNEF